MNNKMVDKLRDFLNDQINIKKIYKIIDVARLCGVEHATLSRFLSQPDKNMRGDTIAKILKGLDIYFDDELNVHHRSELMSSQSIDVGQRDTQQAWAGPADMLGGVPVIGLALCSLSGWYNAHKMAITVPRVGDQARNSTIFAVMAIGLSMAPAGVLPGRICYCDPTMSPDIGDTALVERQDGTMAIKVYKGFKDGFFIIQGWLDPLTEGGEQKMYSEKAEASTIRRVVPVTYIKLK